MRGVFIGSISLNRLTEKSRTLLQDSNLKVFQIAKLVGFSSIGTFSKALLNWSGMRPAYLRKNGRKSPWFPADLLARAVAGGLTLNEAQSLIRHLRTLYPQVQTARWLPDATTSNPAHHTHA